MKAVVFVAVALVAVCVNEAASNAADSLVAGKEGEDATHKVTTQHEEAGKAKTKDHQHMAGKSKVTPVQKVLQMMQGMVAKGQEEKHAEEVQFAAYKQFCDDTQADKTKSIKEAEAQMEVLEAEIEKAATAIERLTTEIAGHEDDIATWAGDTKAATKVRAIEKADFEKLHQDYSESIDACNSAIKTLKKQQYDRPQVAASFIQVIKQLKKVHMEKHIPEKAKRAFADFLAEEGDTKAASLLEAPEANAYEFQSGSIIAMLEQLEDKFFNERTKIEKDEKSSADAYVMLMNDLKASTERAVQLKTEKSQTKSKKQMIKVEKEGDLETTTKDKDEDVMYLKDLVATCTKKSGDFEKRQELREQELEAIQQAISVIDSEAVKGSAEAYLPSFAQKGSTALAQLRGQSQSDEDQEEARNSIVKFLQDRANSLHSRVLSTLVTRVAVGADPFLKVKKMIKDMIVRLEDEALAEAEHKGWCDKELGTNKNTRTSLTDEVDTLNAEIDSLEASISMLGDQIASLSKQVAELMERMEEATKLRTAEKDKNAATIKDAKEAQAAVAQALTILRDFYSKASEATVFAQQATKARHAQPEIFDSTPYTGMQGENGGVIGMLEVIESDFARLEAETEAAEAVAAKEYDQFMSDSKVDQEGKETSIDHKQKVKSDQEISLGTKKEDVFAATKQLEAALAYFDRLKEDCIAENVSFEDRVKQRKAEIESLQEALRILSGKDLA